MDATTTTLGAVWTPPDQCRFRVWAPRATTVTLRLLGTPDRRLAMVREPHGYFTLTADDVRPGQRYLFRLDDGPERPDPASRWQPDGVHAASAVLDPAFAWTDASWRGRELADLVLYELHVGTFTPEGTFDAAIGQLDRLRDLGVTALEVMPVAQFPGTRNWGYDGTYLFAVQNSYGGPAAFQRFIDACHARRLAVLLDVVYNHLGPEGNYLGDFGPYFTQRFRTLWGDGLNYSGRGSDAVRDLIVANARWWQSAFHVDGLRLDAVPWIVDLAPRHVLAELADATRRQAARLGRPFHLVGEIDTNDVRYLLPEAAGGVGLSAQWVDDLHHALHALLTGERGGYYADFGRIDDLARAYREAYAFTGQYSIYRDRRHGTSARGRPAEQFVVFAQNHDQVGNRAHGERLSELTDFDGLKLAAGLLLLSPCVPLLFMGEEYGETAPFHYFTSHGDPRLAQAVAEGRRREFAAFAWKGVIADPQAEATFAESKLQVDRAASGPGRVLHDFHRELLHLRRSLPALAQPTLERQEVTGFEERGALWVRRWGRGDEVAALFQLRGTSRGPWPFPAGSWQLLLDSSASLWAGPGSDLPERVASGGSIELPLRERAFAVYRRIAN